MIYHKLFYTSKVYKKQFIKESSFINLMLLYYSPTRH